MTHLALDDSAAARLADLVADVAREPARVRTHFPAAARQVGRGPLDPADPQGLRGPTLDDAVRAALLVALAGALRDDPSRLSAEVSELYRYGDAAEKRAVLRALPELPALGESGLPLVADALRTNDVRLVAAALGEYAVEHLDQEAWRQGVLKCLFVGVPLAVVAGLDGRADAQLAGMVARYVHERVAAGRDVPGDVWLVLDRFPDALGETGLSAELDSPHEDRRAAARRALAGRPVPSPSRLED
ncbi:MAG TPA: EboA domain-containing protein [Jiangellales bacterium]|nr:EboA domain-containing protein [Jiangellales bacterium]